MNPESELAVVIPTKNDESTIGSLVLLTRQMVNTVIVVDDVSQDRTSTSLISLLNRSHSSSLHALFGYPGFLNA